MRARGLVDAASFEEIFCSVKFPRKTRNGSDLYVILDRSGRNWKKDILEICIGDSKKAYAVSRLP